MKRRISLNRWALLLALAVFGLFSCILEDGSTAKRGSEVENEVYGVLVALDGRPVQGAKVKAVPVASVAKRASPPGADTARAETDAKGRYGFPDLPAGSYNLYGSHADGNLVVLIPEVDWRRPGKALFVGVDTLRVPGRIRGRVLVDGRGEEGALCYVPGTSYLAVSDDSGRFERDLPQGLYTVRCSKDGYLTVTDSGVAVRSGRTTDLPGRSLSADPKLPPPAPTGLLGTLDSGRMRVRLAWNPVRVEDLQGYLVYRDDPDLLEPKPVGLATDTVFVDSAFPLSDSARTLVYRVRAGDRDASLSLAFSPAATVAVPADSGAIRSAWLAPVGDTAEAGGTVRLILGYESPRRGLKRLEWRIAGRDTVLRFRENPGRSGRDTLTWMAVPGRTIFQVDLFDESGRVTRAARGLSVPDPHPLTRVDAGSDVAASLGTSITLSARVPESFGTVTRWEWRLGSERSYRATAAGDTTFRLPPGVDSLEGTVRVTNTSGVTDSDRVMVHIVRPKGIVFNETPVVAPFPGREIRHLVPFKGKAYLFGGHTGRWITDEVIYEVSEDAWSSADGLTWTEFVPKGLPRRYPGHVLVHDGKLWIIGGSSAAEPEGFDDVWNSEDGETFTKVCDSAGLRNADAVFSLPRALVAVIRRTPGSEGDLWASRTRSSVNGVSWTTSETPLPFVATGTYASGGGRHHLQTLEGRWYSEDGFAWHPSPPLEHGPEHGNFLMISGELSIRMVRGFSFDEFPGMHAMGVWTVSGTGASRLINDAVPETGQFMTAGIQLGGRLLLFTTGLSGAPARYETRIWSTR